MSRMTIARLSLLALTALVILAVLIYTPLCVDIENENLQKEDDQMEITLPEPRLASSVSLEMAISLRRSVREFKNEALTLAELGQLLWTAQGVTDPSRGLRAAPSAGALYPLEIYIAAGIVEELPSGIYRYIPKTHKLASVSEGDPRDALSGAALGQDCITSAPVSICIAAVYARTSGKYGARAKRYVHIETGHAAENLCLQAVALGLATVPVGAFNDDKVKNVLSLRKGEEPLYIIPVGRK